MVYIPLYAIDVKQQSERTALMRIEIEKLVVLLNANRREKERERFHCDCQVKRERRDSFYVISLTVFATVMSLRQSYGRNLPVRFSAQSSIYL